MSYSKVTVRDGSLRQRRREYNAHIHDTVGPLPHTWRSEPNSSNFKVIPYTQHGKQTRILTSNVCTNLLHYDDLGATTESAQGTILGYRIVPLVMNATHGYHAIPIISGTKTGIDAPYPTKVPAVFTADSDPNGLSTEAFSYDGSMSKTQQDFNVNYLQHDNNYRVGTDTMTGYNQHLHNPNIAVNPSMGATQHELGPTSIKNLFPGTTWRDGIHPTFEGGYMEIEFKTSDNTFMQVGAYGEHEIATSGSTFYSRASHGENDSLVGARTSDIGWDDAVTPNGNEHNPDICDIARHGMMYTVPVETPNPLNVMEAPLPLSIAQNQDNSKVIGPNSTHVVVVPILPYTQFAEAFSDGSETHLSERVLPNMLDGHRHLGRGGALVGNMYARRMPIVEFLLPSNLATNNVAITIRYKQHYNIHIGLSQSALYHLMSPQTYTIGHIGKANDDPGMHAIGMGASAPLAIMDRHQKLKNDKDKNVVAAAKSHPLVYNPIHSQLVPVPNVPTHAKSPASSFFHSLWGGVKSAANFVWEHREQVGQVMEFAGNQAAQRGRPGIGAGLTGGGLLLENSAPSHKRGRVEEID